MKAINLAEAKAHFSELVDKVQAGASIDIMRRGRAVARLVAIECPRKPMNIAQLRALTGSMRPAAADAANVVRSMRDADRY